MEDHELLEKIRNADTKMYGFNLLVRKYQEKLYYHIRRMVVDHDDADDLTQETFIKVYKHIDTFRGESNLYTWIFRIGTNECLTFLQRKRRRFFLPIADISEALAAKIDSSPAMEADEIQKKLQKALLKLPDKQRLVFNMRYFDEMSYEDMSAVTSTSVGALKASYHLAVKKIEEYLND